MHFHSIVGDTLAGKKEGKDKNETYGKLSGKIFNPLTPVAY
jgi:hypothetical protein